MKRNRQLWVVSVLVPFAVMLASCGGTTGGPETKDEPTVSWIREPRPIAGLSQQSVGEGSGAAMLLWRKGAPPPRKAVIFLHGWLPLPPVVYSGWLRHLAEGGSTIIYPVYQRIGAAPATFRAAALAGIRAALDARSIDPGQLMVIGHVTGGALAFDYAAVAAGEGLPRPRAVLAVYPARRSPGGVIPLADPAGIPPQTQLEVIAGPGDPVPGGTAEARSLLRRATAVPVANRTYVAAPPPPSLRTPPSMWRAADRLIARARGG